VPSRTRTVTVAFGRPPDLSWRTASRARTSVANGLAVVPGLSSLPPVATTKSTRTGGSATTRCAKSNKETMEIVVGLISYQFPEEGEAAEVVPADCPEGEGDRAEQADPEVEAPATATDSPRSLRDAELLGWLRVARTIWRRICPRLG